MVILRNITAALLLLASPGALLAQAPQPSPGAAEFIIFMAGQSV